MKNKPIKIAVIGGSGLYSLNELENVKKLKIKTPFGLPSDAIVAGEISGVQVAFLPRHGCGHRMFPAEIPQRANIYALKSLGVETIIGVSAVGSLKEEIKPRHFVFPDQLVDETKGRVSTFFGNGIVAHVSFAEPFCKCLSETLYKGAKELGIASHKGGTIICMEGPQFSTKAESDYHRKMGYSIIGMTVSPEAKLAKEAQMCYAPVSLVTDYDAWKENEEVTATMVIETMRSNIESVKKLIVHSIPEIAKMQKNCRCAHAMQGAVFTDSKYISKKTSSRLKLLLK